MTIYREEGLRDFEFWSGARDTVAYLTDEELDTIETELESLYPEGLDETTVNDFFWFDDDTIAEWLGYPDFETLMDERKEEGWWVACIMVFLLATIALFPVAVVAAAIIEKVACNDKRTLWQIIREMWQVRRPVMAALLLPLTL